MLGGRSKAGVRLHHFPRPPPSSWSRVTHAGTRSPLDACILHAAQTRGRGPPAPPGAQPGTLAGGLTGLRRSTHRVPDGEGIVTLSVGEELITKQQDRQQCPDCLPPPRSCQLVPVPTELTVGDEGSWNTS